MMKFRPFERSHAEWSGNVKTSLSELTEHKVEVLQGRWF